MHPEIIRRVDDWLAGQSQRNLTREWDRRLALLLGMVISNYLPETSRTVLLGSGVTISFASNTLRGMLQTEGYTAGQGLESELHNEILNELIYPITIWVEPPPIYQN